MTDKIALITGGSRGLGRNTALHLAKKGVGVVLTYLSRSTEADAVVAEIERSGGKAVAGQWQLITINPGFVMGPGINSKATSESFNFIKQLVDGVFRYGATNYGIPYVDVRDVAEAHLNAAFNANADGRYIVSAVNSTIPELAQILRDTFGDTFPIKKAELEQHVMDELRWIRTIESRLKQIQERGKNVHDVVVKQIPEQPFISMRSAAASWDEALEFFISFQPMLCGLDQAIYGPPVVVFHADGGCTELIEFEIGLVLNTSSDVSLTAPDGTALTVRPLESAIMATFVMQGPSYEAHIGFSVIGEWAEANHYKFAGPVREIVLQAPQRSDMTDLIMELQFPVQKHATD